MAEVLFLARPRKSTQKEGRPATCSMSKKTLIESPALLAASGVRKVANCAPPRTSPADRCDARLRRTGLIKSIFMKRLAAHDKECCFCRVCIAHRYESIKYLLAGGAHLCKTKRGCFRLTQPSTASYRGRSASLFERSEFGSAPR